MNFVQVETLPVQTVVDVPPGLDTLGPMLSRRFTTYGADAKRSIFQLVTTATPFIALLAVMAWASHDRYWLTLLLAIPTAGLLVRLFIIQHDCGHGSFFKSRAANDFVGRALSVLTLTPYDSWKRDHATHHASTGNLDRRGRGDVETMTVAEYQASSPLKKLAYRLFRNPLVMVMLGAPINFILLQRFPKGYEFSNRQSRRSILLLDLALLVAFGLPCAIFGFRSCPGNVSSRDDHRVVGRELAVLRPAPVRRGALGARGRLEFPRRRRRAAAHTSGFRRSCNGFLETSDCITCTTYVVAFQTTAFRPVSTLLRNWMASPG